MPSFNYVAVDEVGKNRRGTMEASDDGQVLAKLRAEGLTVLEVKPADILSKDLNISIGQSIKPRDLSVFCRQFVSIVSAGVTIIDALGMLADSTENKTMSDGLRKVQTDIGKGEAMSEAMAKHPKVFPKMLVQMVAAGEASGNLEVSFERMAEQFEKSAKIQALIKKAAVYPIIVCIVAVAVMVIMLVKVIPSYEDMFADMGSELPGITKAAVAMSNFLIEKWYILIAVIVAAVVALVMFGKTDSGQKVFGKIGYKLPIFGKLTIKTASSQFARTLSTMIAAGIPMMDALDNVARTMKNALFRDAVYVAKDEVSKGVPLSEPIERCGLFPPMVYHMIRIGEETGDTESMLERLADYYDEEVEMETQTVMAALEPMIIMVLAVIVIFIIGAVMAPMLKMYQDLGNL